MFQQFRNQMFHKQIMEDSKLLSLGIDPGDKSKGTPKKDEKKEVVAAKSEGGLTAAAYFILTGISADVAIPDPSDAAWPK